MKEFWIDETDAFMHYGVKYRSGRYPYGSGENPYQHDAKQFISRVEELRAQGLDEQAIGKYFGVNSKELRNLISYATNEKRAAQINQVDELAAQGLSNSEIARRLGLPNESSVRSLKDEKVRANTYATSNLVSFLEEQVKDKGMIDVGAGVEYDLNISRTKLDTALYILEKNGYKTYNARVGQVTNPNQGTINKILTPEGTKYKEVYDAINNNEIATVKDYMFDSDDPYGKPKRAWEYPASLDSKRVQIVYAEDGGEERDGLVELRPGVKDISLGDSTYSQVRILVDGTHYIKGMAVYNPDLPKGVDVRFNTNKHVGTPMLSDDPDAKQVLKPIQTDSDNPFGANLKERGGQVYYEDVDGTRHLGVINKTREEGDWTKWSDALPSQFLAKQPVKLIKQQLKISEDRTANELESIMELTQPTIKKQLLLDFANDCDSASAELAAAALPNQKYKVILPSPSLKDNEVYAPGLDQGQEVALVRFPHAGTFEIPRLKVNNRNKEAKGMIGNADDAICINKNVADILSGADFDGDTVLCIPITSTSDIQSRDPLPGLKGFDPKAAYPKVNGMKTLTKAQEQIEMGKVSNLITDMTLKGATDEELERAVRHSMVVIDARKHKLNYKASEKDNNIKELVEKYKTEYSPILDKVSTGSSTFISRAGADVDVPKRRGAPYIDKEGKLVYKVDEKRFYEETKVVKDKQGNVVIGDNGKPLKEKTGKIKERTEKVKQISLVDDARLLSSGTIKENIYADYSNYMKDMATKARKLWKETPGAQKSVSATQTYKDEVNSLTTKVKLAKTNAPKERAAQRLAKSTVQAQIDANPELAKDKKKLGKVRQAALVNARLATGAASPKITITDREWEAIQSNALTNQMVTDIYRYSDKDELRKRATPKVRETTLSRATINRIKSLDKTGYTTAEIAKYLGVSTSSVSKYLKE